MNSPTDFPNDTDVEKGYAILGRLLSCGANPQLLADGRIIVGGLATAHESTWCRENRAAFQSALVGAGRYVEGSLDRIYGIGKGDASSE